MKVFQITLKGFDGSSSNTDHLILWISAETRKHIINHLETKEIEYESIDEIGIDPQDSAVDYSI